MSEWSDFARLEAHLWARLRRAAANATDPWRYVALATQGAEGPQVRTVGFRGADRHAGRIEVHTDARTPKVAQLSTDPRAQLLFWDARTQEQLRLSVTMEIVPGDLSRWTRVPAVARSNYGTDPEPGTPIDAAEAFTRTPEEARFAALVGRVTGMDAVLLATEPHRRAIWQADGWSWVAP